MAVRPDHASSVLGVQTNRRRCVSIGLVFAHGVQVAEHVADVRQAVLQAQRLSGLRLGQVTPGTGLPEMQGRGDYAGFQALQPI